jgi:hypothetical protein
MNYIIQVQNINYGMPLDVWVTYTYYSTNQTDLTNYINIIFPSLDGWTWSYQNS